MPRNLLFALALALVVGVTALVLWPEDGIGALEGEGDNQSASTAPALDLAKAQAPLVAVLEEATRVKNTAQVEDIVVGLTRGDTPLEAHYEGLDGFKILVLEGEAETPVADADVYLLDHSKFSRERLEAAWRARFSGGMALARELGQHYRTDANGVVRAPLPASEPSPLHVNRLTILAEHDGLVAVHINHRPIEEEVRLVLHDNQTLEVKVVDQSEAVVGGAPIALLYGEPPTLLVAESMNSNDNGIAYFENLDQSLEYAELFGSAYVSLGLPGIPNECSEQIRVELLDEVIASGHVTLVVPPICNVRVTVLDAQGRPFLGDGSVGLHRPDNKPGLSRGFSPSERIINGQAEFNFVGTNIQLAARFRGLTQNNPDQVLFDAPQQADEWVEVEIIRPNFPTLTGTLVGPDGKVLSERNIIFRDFIPKQRRYPGRKNHITTDGNGRFQIEPTVIPDYDQVVKHKIQLSLESEELGACKVEFEVMAGPTSGGQDMGELMLQSEATILAGTVRDREDNPIYNAKIEIKYLTKREAPSNYWRFARAASGESARDGKFACYGELPEGVASKAKFSAPGFENLEQEFTPGLVDAVFRLKKASALEGTILVDEHMATPRLSLVLIDGQDYQHTKLTKGNAPGLSNFRFEGKVETPYTLEIHTDLRQILYRTEDLFFLPGQVTRPPELQPLDLRGKLQAIKIDVQNAQGEPLEGKVIFEQKDSTIHRRVVEGITSLIIVGELPEIRVTSKGYADQTLTHVTSDQFVVLKPAIEVYVQIPSIFLNHRGIILDIYVSSKTSNSLFRENIPASKFDESGRAVIWLNKPGEYEIGLDFKVPPNRSRGHFLRQTTFQITEAGQVINLEIDQEELDRKIDRVMDQ